MSWKGNINNGGDIMEPEVYVTRLACIIYSLIGFLTMSYIVNPIEEIKVLPMFVAILITFAMAICLNKGKWYLMTISPNSYTMSIAIALLCANLFAFSVTDATLLPLMMFRYIYAFVGYMLVVLATVLVR